MPAKSLKLDSLELDLENPRIVLATDQRDAMQKIISEQKVKLVNLAESVSANGLSPMNRCLVLRSDRAGKFIVLEGNRRILCAKLLKNPALIHTFTMPEAFRKRLEKAAQKFDPKRVEPIDCFEVADRIEGNDWIRQRHTGEDSGRGVVDWSAVASSRFAGRDPALQALEFVLQYGNLSDEQIERINNTKFITTLDRLLSTPTVRTAIGFEIERSKLLTELPADEAIKPLKRIVLDLSEKTINVNDVKSKEQQNAYVAKLRATDRADLAKKSGAPITVDSITAKDFKAKAPPAAPKARMARAAARTSIVPRSCKLNVTTPKIGGIYGELKTLLLTKHVHAIGVLFRVFLEMSVDDYMTRNKLPFTYHDVKNNRHNEKTLRTKVKDTVDHMVQNGANAKDLKGVTSAMSDPNHPFAIDTLHAYIHNRFFTPIDRHLITGWDNAEPFFGIIWQ